MDIDIGVPAGHGKENMLSTPVNSPMKDLPTRSRSRAHIVRTPQKDMPSPVRALIEPFIGLDVDTPTKSRKRSRADITQSIKEESLSADNDDLSSIKTPKKKRKIESSASIQNLASTSAASIPVKSSSTDLVSKIVQRTQSFTKTLRSVGKMNSRRNISVSTAESSQSTSMDVERSSSSDKVTHNNSTSSSKLRSSSRAAIFATADSTGVETLTLVRSPQRSRRPSARQDPYAEMKHSYSCATLPRNSRSTRPTVLTRTASSEKFNAMIKAEKGWIIESGCPHVTALDVSTVMGSTITQYGPHFIDALFSGAATPLSETDSWYSAYFAPSEHQNYLAVEETQGPVSISVMKHGDLVRAIIRTEKRQEKIVIPSSVLLKGSGNLLFGAKKDKRALLKSIIPAGWHLKNVKEVKETKHIGELTMFETNEVATKFKWGVLYCAPGQTHEDEMFANNVTSPAFEEFLSVIGDKIELKNWTGYTGGLDTTRNATGTHSVYTKFNDYDIMFHVAPYLPHDPECPQQLERKRHLGNDVVVIVFMDRKPGSTSIVDDPIPYLPTTIRTHFQHILAVVQRDPTSEKPRYRLHIARKDDVPEFGPELPSPSVYDKSSFRSVLLAKLVNGERAALKAPAFERAISRTRSGFINYYHQEYLKK